jgi:hypothetical protein
MAALVFLGTACGSSPGASLPQSATTITIADAVADTGSPQWNDYVGAHYSARPWARGGLRDPGGVATAYRPRDGGVADDGLDGFLRSAVPELRGLLQRGEYAVLQAGGASPGFFDAIKTQTGRAAFAAALGNRIDLIHAMPEARGWESRVVFQFGNEIQNPMGFYGVVCLWATRGRTDTCDPDTEFAPTYVDLYLAPGVEILRAKSQELFGRPDAIRIALGSVVNLVSRRSFVEALLNRRVGDTAAPMLTGQLVSSLVDTVTIHYTMGSPQAPAIVDDFFTRWTSPDVGTVRSLWMTEEMGVRAARDGYALNTALRAIAPSLRWWKSRGLSPANAHIFIWGADQRCEVSTSGCLSLDQSMPVFADFVGANELVETSDASATSSQPLTIYSYRAGPNRRVVLAWLSGGAGSGSATVTAINLDLSPWLGRQVAASLRRVGAEGLPELPTSADRSGFVFSTTITDREALLLMLEAR